MNDAVHTHVDARNICGRNNILILNIEYSWLKTCCNRPEVLVYLFFGVYTQGKPLFGGFSEFCSFKAAFQFVCYF